MPISSYINSGTLGDALQFRLKNIHPDITYKPGDERGKFPDERDKFQDERGTNIYQTCSAILNVKFINLFRVQAAITRQQVRISSQGVSKRVALPANAR